LAIVLYSEHVEGEGNNFQTTKDNQTYLQEPDLQKKQKDFALPYNANNLNGIENGGG